MAWRSAADQIGFGLEIPKIEHANIALNRFGPFTYRTNARIYVFPNRVAAPTIPFDYSNRAEACLADAKF
ncbi:hypothetical protein NBRC116588_04520 [Pyruvatibacter sp. HU-CL02332]